MLFVIFVETACVLTAGVGSLHETSQHAHRNCL